MLLLNERLLLFISLSTQSGNFWIHPHRGYISMMTNLNPENGGSTTSETLVSNHLSYTTTQKTTTSTD